MFWRRRAWTPTAAMSPCRATATAWTCIMAATTSPARTGLSAPCRATGPRIWRRITSGSIRRRSYAERRGITFRARVAEIVRKIVPEKVRDMFDGLRLPADGRQEPERAAPERKAAEDPETALRRARTKALVRHARAVDAIFAAGDVDGKGQPRADDGIAGRPQSLRGGASLWLARCRGRLFRRTRSLPMRRRRARSTAPSARSSSKPKSAPIRPGAPTASWSAGRSSTKPASASIRRATCPATRPRGRPWATWRKASNAIRSLNPSSPTASEDLGIGIESGRRLGLELAFSHGIDLGRGRGIGL